MPDETIDDGRQPFPLPERDQPDAHGQAGLLLAESILHALLDARLFTLNQAIEAVRVAAEVKVDVAAESGETDTKMEHSLRLLAAIGQSLTADRERAANEP